MTSRLRLRAAAGGDRPGARGRARRRRASCVLPRADGRAAPPRRSATCRDLLAPGRPPRRQPQPRLPRAPAGAPRRRRRGGGPAAARPRRRALGRASCGPGRRLRPGRRGRRSTTSLSVVIESEAARPRTGGGGSASSPSAGDVRRGPRALRPRPAAALHPPARPTRPTASATRRSTPARRAAWPRPPPACTSRTPLLGAAGGARAWRRPRSCCTSARAPSGPSPPSDVEDHRGRPRAVRGAAPRRRRRSAATRARGGRVVAVGTTTVRTLETAARDGGTDRGRPGETDLVIVPGLRLPGGGRAGHQLPPAALVAAAAGGGLRRPRARARGLRGGGARGLSLLQLRRRDAASGERLRPGGGACSTSACSRPS